MQYRENIINTKNGFSVLEVLLAIFIIGILGVSLMRSISALKAQNYTIQHFLVTNTSLFETQLFINRQLSSIKPESIAIAQNNVSWEQYKELFIETEQNEYMNFSLQTTKSILTLQNNNLYFNNAILLHNVKSMQFNRMQVNSHDILSYSICSFYMCISDSILIEKVR
ncbi:type II secretion system protein [Helicobacter trogontum]|uniref:Prepilin-type N-terminal cleavage/methylation domain-containing protein n=1 Tax=Helicobacter trogontum TaxID=50960 RepID=A0ABQ0D4A8_9HELI|nr:type II secretion system protein [Helicobacter trogontum]MCI5785956.1 type II secretion system GspH family protein [Helicobacter trogontum]MDY5185313.1 type II secretion system protein [Helicobacter trogontum]